MPCAKLCMARTSARRPSSPWPSSMAPDHGASPAIDAVVRQVGGARLLRPFDPAALLVLVDRPARADLGGVMDQAAS